MLPKAYVAKVFARGSFLADENDLTHAIKGLAEAGHQPVESDNEPGGHTGNAVRFGKMHFLILNVDASARRYEPGVVHRGLQIVATEIDRVLRLRFRDNHLYVRVEWRAIDISSAHLTVPEVEFEFPLPEKE